MKVRLEIDHIQVHRPKKRWQLYFVVAAEHPEKNDEMVVTILPQHPILVVPGQNNQVDFQASGKGAEGLHLLSRELTTNRELNVHVYVMHSRRGVKDIAKVLQSIEGGLGKEAGDIVTNILGTSSTWLSIAKQALPMVGKIMERIPDRNMGFISMFERFGPEFESETEVDREVRGGNITMVYSWALERD